MMNLTTLDNGLKVASRTMPGVETVAVGLYAEAGSRHEAARINGIAHLYEHMVFKGAGGRSARELSETIEDVGGDLNACTDRDQTSFTASVLAEHLPLGIELISDMILRPHFAPDDLARAKVVLQELAEARCARRHHLRRSLGDRLAGPAAGPGDPGRRNQHWCDQAGRSAPLADRALPRRPLTLVAAGKVDHDELVRLAEARFAGLPERGRRARSGPLHGWRPCQPEQG